MRSNRFDRAQWGLVPKHLRTQLERYMLEGRLPRSYFLNLVLRNDLLGAVRIGTPVEQGKLVDIVTFLMKECQDESYGSFQDWRDWRAMGGREGMIARMDGDERP